MCRNNKSENTHLLGGGNGSAVPQSSSKCRRMGDLALGFGICAVLAVVVMTMGHHNEAANTVGSLRSQSASSSSTSSSTRSSSSSSSHEDFNTFTKETESKYTRFQAMGFQIYTGGAPAFIPNPDYNKKDDTSDWMVQNPECDDLGSYGHFDDYDAANDTLPASLWQCYLGHADPRQDVEHRLTIMKDAVAAAHAQVIAANDENGSDSDDTLKIFIAPEFFWRGREGAYVFDADSSTEANNQIMLAKDECTEVCQIMLGLEQLVADAKYKDWLFLFGTVVASENLPTEDDYDKLFYNFAPVYKGYDPATQDHHGKRFLVPKRYVSNVDFLTPVRQYNGTIAKEIVELTEQQLKKSQEYLDVQATTTASSSSSTDDDDDEPIVLLSVTPTKIGQEPIVVDNPFELKRDFYDRDMWYEYKEELTSLGYTMIEYDWLVLDNITFTIEVCLDHDARTALNAYLADNVMGSPTRIPKSVDRWDETTQTYRGSIEQVKIPRHQAQISLVSSMGMVANPASLALANNGTLILQDGQSDKNGSMAYVFDCEEKNWHFDGGTEFISRTASFTTTRIDFKFQVHVPQRQVGIYDDLYNSKDNAWKDAVKGVFTTTKYEPKITMYPIRDVAHV